MSIRLSKNGKRLGRPPKNSNTKTFIINETQIEQPKFELQSDEMIECSLVPLNEYSHMNNEVKRFGRYATSTYNLNKYGKNYSENAFTEDRYLRKNIKPLYIVSGDDIHAAR